MFRKQREEKLDKDRERIRLMTMDPFDPEAQQKIAEEIRYCKVPKFSDAKKLCCNLPKIQTKRSNLICQNDANGIANSEDPDQTRSSLILVCTVSPDLSVRKLGVNMVHFLFQHHSRFCYLIKQWELLQPNQSQASNG